MCETLLIMLRVIIHLRMLLQAIPPLSYKGKDYLNSPVNSLGFFLRFEKKLITKARRAGEFEGHAPH